MTAAARKAMAGISFAFQKHTESLKLLLQTVTFAFKKHIFSLYMCQLFPHLLPLQPLQSFSTFLCAKKLTSDYQPLASSSSGFGLGSASGNQGQDREGGVSLLCCSTSHSSGHSCGSPAPFRAGDRTASYQCSPMVVMVP